MTRQEIIKDASADSILAEICLEDNLKKPGDLCPYSALSEATGHDPRERPWYGYVKTARRRFEMKHECVLVVVPNQGIRWEPPAGVLASVHERDAGHIRRSVKAAFRRQKTTLKEKDLSPEMSKRRYENLAQLGVLAHIGKAATRRKIAQAAHHADRLLGAGEVIAHLQKES